MIYNDVDLSDFIIVQSITGRGPFTQDNTLASIPGRYGGRFVKKTYPPRQIGITFTILGDSETDRRIKIDQLNSILNVEGPSPMVFEDESDKVYYGVVDGSADWSETDGFDGKGKRTFICPDPFKYGPSKTEQIGTSTDPNITIVTLFATQVSDYTTYAAPVSALPVFDVTFDNPSTDFQITHTESGKYVRVVYDFVAGDTLTIDHKTRKIMINDVNHMTALDWANSEFFELVTGENHFTITENVANTEITYEPRWL